MVEELKVRRTRASVQARFPIEEGARFNFYVHLWNRGPNYPVYLWETNGRRSVPGQIMNEAGVPSNLLMCDDDMPIWGKRLRYLHTHVVPDDCVKIRATYGWIGGMVCPNEIVEQHPWEGDPPLALPLCLLGREPKKVWDLLIELNDRTLYVDMHTADVVESVPWQTRAYWIREMLRHFGVGIAFRSSAR